MEVNYIDIVHFHNQTKLTKKQLRALQVRTASRQRAAKDLRLRNADFGLVVLLKFNPKSAISNLLTLPLTRGGSDLVSVYSDE
jgi:hypothetical protein